MEAINISESIYFESINQGTLNKANQGTLNKAAKLFPGKNCLEILKESRDRLYHYHPILLNDKPFSSDDPFLLKIFKQLKFSTILFFSFPKTKKLFRIYQASNQFVSSKNQEMNDLNKEIDFYFKDIFLLQFHLEFNEYLQENNNNDAQETINLALDSYQTVLNSRGFIWLEGKQMTLNEDLINNLVDEKRHELGLFAKEIIENPLGLDFKQKNEKLEKDLEELFKKKTALSQAFNDIRSVLNDPLDLQLRIIDETYTHHDFMIQNLVSDVLPRSYRGHGT